MLRISISLLLIFSACNARSWQGPVTGRGEHLILNKAGKTIATRFMPPEGYKRIVFPEGSYPAYLRNLPLKPDGSAVHYFDGGEKPNPGIYAAVLTFDAGKEDLQQCADAVMRIRAEYLYSIDKKSAIGFSFTNGFIADYPHWQQGYRIAVSGSKVSWIKKVPPTENYASFRKYLDMVYAYAGTRSLAGALKKVAFEKMEPGDVLVVGGSPGHAVTIMDMAEDASGRKLYLLSQSYMPAQDIQILCNRVNPAISPWYELKEEAGGIIHTPQWDFTTKDLKRF